MLIDVRSVYVWLSVLAVLLGMFLSAESGVWAGAQRLVPPIARESLRPELERLEKLQEKAAADEKAADLAIVQEFKAADQANLSALRQDIQDLRLALGESQKTMNRLLLQLAAERSGRR